MALIRPWGAHADGQLGPKQDLILPTPTPVAISGSEGRLEPTRPLFGIRFLWLKPDPSYTVGLFTSLLLEASAVSSAMAACSSASTSPRFSSP
jgi:hypothetical protein